MGSRCLAKGAVPVLPTRGTALTCFYHQVVVCIIADGRKKVHPRVLDCLTLLGVYQPGGHMNNKINNKAVTAHLFEYTTSFALDPDLHFRYPDKGIMPTQVIFCMKEKNQKKINSHRWFFNAFGRMLQPNVCILLDVGTRPGNKSLYHLWKTFDLNSNVGGACGEIAAYKGKYWTSLFNPLGKPFSVVGVPLLSDVVCQWRPRTLSTR